MSINDARKQSLYFPEEMLVEIEQQAQRPSGISLPAFTARCG